MCKLVEDGNQTLEDFPFRFSQSIAFCNIAGICFGLQHQFWSVSHLKTVIARVESGRLLYEYRRSNFMTIIISNGSGLNKLQFQFVRTSSFGNASCQHHHLNLAYPLLSVISLVLVPSPFIPLPKTTAITFLFLFRLDKSLCLTGRRWSCTQWLLVLCLLSSPTGYRW